MRSRDSGERKGKTSKPAVKSSSKPAKAVRSGKPKPVADGKLTGGEAPRRKMGIRGAAPWAARHAAKHAAEARARAALPPPPGSARATLREPRGADEIKARIAALHDALERIKDLRKNLAHGFYEVGLVLRDIESRRLYQARGFGTFDAFVERELDKLSKSTALRFMRLTEVFQKDAAHQYGLDKLTAALAALESTEHPAPQASTNVSSGPLPLRPPTAAKR